MSGDNEHVLNLCIRRLVGIAALGKTLLGSYIMAIVITISLGLRNVCSKHVQSILGERDWHVETDNTNVGLK